MADRAPKFKHLADAVCNGSVTEVRRLLAAGKDPNEVEEAGDVTTLMAAAARGDLDVVKALVESGADVNALAEDLSGDLDAFPFVEEAYQFAELHGMSALLYALLYGHEEVRQYLYDRTDRDLRAQCDAVARRAGGRGE